HRHNSAMLRQCQASSLLPSPTAACIRLECGRETAFPAPPPAHALRSSQRAGPERHPRFRHPPQSSRILFLPSWNLRLKHKVTHLNSLSPSSSPVPPSQPHQSSSTIPACPTRSTYP